MRGPLRVSFIAALALSTSGCDRGELEQQNEQIRQLIDENTALARKLQEAGLRSSACGDEVSRLRNEVIKLELVLEARSTVGESGSVDPQHAHDDGPER